MATLDIILANKFQKILFDIYAISSFTYKVISNKSIMIIKLILDDI